MKSGDIIFLTRRPRKFGSYRAFISRSIAVFTRRKGQKLKDVKVHAAIIYEKDSKLYVREMEQSGNINILLDYYLIKFKGRIEVVKMPKSSNPHAIKIFNKRCEVEKVKYDYLNTFVWQSLRAVSHKWIGSNTPYVRMCAEDVQRMYNIIDHIFMAVEKTNPNELREYIKSTYDTDRI